MRTFFRFLKPHAWWVVLCVALKILGAFAELAMPRVLAGIIDDAVPRGDMNDVITYGVVMIILAFLTLIFNLFGNRISGVTSGKIAYDIRAALFEKTLYIDSSSADKFGTASLTSRLTSDTYNVTHFFTRLQRVGLKGPIMLLGGIVMTLTIDYRLALVLMLILPFVVIAVYTISRKSVPIYNEEQKILDKMVRQVDETSRGIRVIKALSKSDYEADRFSHTSKELHDKEIEAGRLMSLTKPITDLLLNLGFCLVIFVGFILSEKSGYSASGALLAFMTYFTLILNSTVLMTRIFVQMSKSVASVSRIEEVLSADFDTYISENNLEPLENAPYILFENVNFSYGKKSNTLTDISFSLGRGETLGIIGATGSGKSTIINLLLGLYKPDSGKIMIDGVPISNIPTEKLRRMFGVAFQNDFVFSGTIRENVEFFRDGDIDSALEIAQAEFVKHLEDGVEHRVTSRATNLSGGQRQRILVARALFGNPEILILDDASSALDYKTDKSMRRAIEEDVKSTTFIVAQRISSVMRADTILLLDDGKILAKGSHEELMTTSPLYREIAEIQMGKAGDVL